MNKKNNETFGQYILRLREREGYSQRRLASLTGVSNTTISTLRDESEMNSFPFISPSQCHNA